MVVRLVVSIFALVLTLLGIVFTILGLLSTAEDADAFKVVGPAVLAAGLLLTAIAFVLFRRAKAERDRRRAGSRASVEVVEARLNQYTRIGVMLTYDLTIRYADGATHTRKVLLPPTQPIRAGDRVDVLHDPADPGNFEVVTDG
jgi:hypothetical protein